MWNRAAIQIAAERVGRGKQSALVETKSATRHFAGQERGLERQHLACRVIDDADLALMQSVQVFKGTSRAAVELGAIKIDIERYEPPSKAEGARCRFNRAIVASQLKGDVARRLIRKVYVGPAFLAIDES